MLTRRLVAIPLAGAATLALATAVLAGGWATVTVTDPPADPPAGRETLLDLTVLQHGVTPVSWPIITVIATDAESGATVAGQAKASGSVGHYTVGLTFPSGGAWAIAFVSQDLVMQGSERLVVGPPLVDSASTRPAGGTPDWPVIGVLVIVVALFLATFAAMVIHDRRLDRRTREQTPTAPAASA